MSESRGRWPRAIKRAWFDLLSKKRAPENDGIVAPTINLPDWFDKVPALPEVLEIAVRARESEEGAANLAEEKASRLLQLALALLAISLALGAFQLRHSIGHSVWYWLALIPVTSSIFFLAIAAFEASQIDRVGFYGLASVADCQEATAEDVTRAAVKAEFIGTALADWTRRNKHSDLMQARAWLTRGLLALIVSALVAGVVVAWNSTLPAPSHTSLAAFKFMTCQILHRFTG